MRLVSIHISDAPPVRRFEVSGLSNVVVLAGPNGVGKTRLLNALVDCFRNPRASGTRRIEVEATSDAERQEWGKSRLDTAAPSDVEALRRTLQRNRSRSAWTSSLIHFESDRSIQQLQPYTFSWDIVDPFLENIGWDFAFQGLKNRFQDTLHSIFRTVQSRRNEIALRAEQLIRSGATSMELDFRDPIAPFKSAFAQLLAPKILLEPEAREQRLFYEFEGQKHSIDTLSSGEREVVNVVFDFILRVPSHSIVIFDEPELHLHPELSYRLLQTLQTVGYQNQFVFCTHSPEIITAALDNSVVFVSPPKDHAANQAIPVREDDETHQALRLLGQSVGIVALGRKIVLIEGVDTSLDKQLYGSILRNRFPNLVLVPSGGKQVIQSFATLVDSVLSRSIWGVEFFMLCDRDAVPPHADAVAIERGAAGRLRVLSRYHLENYFLDESIIAAVFREMVPPASWLVDANRVRAELRSLALGMVSYTVALGESAFYRQRVGAVDLMPKGVHTAGAEELIAKLQERARQEVERVETMLDVSAIEQSARSRLAELNDSLERDTDDWKRLVPGKQLLSKFASKANIDVGWLKALYINHAERTGSAAFSDIVDVFRAFSEQ